MVTIVDITKATQDCLIKAKELFGVDLSSTTIVYNLRGTSRGTASWVESKSHGIHTLKLRYNKEAIILDTDTFINTVIPHEVAHLVCALRSDLGYGHNKGWKNICLQLGGNGQRCHSQTLTPGRRTRRYEYIATCGTKIVISSVRHGKIQKRGKSYTLKTTYGKLDRTCRYRLAA